jgi:hypothetical protein
VSLTKACSVVRSEHHQINNGTTPGLTREIQFDKCVGFQLDQRSIDTRRVHTPLTTLFVLSLVNYLLEPHHNEDVSNNKNNSSKNNSNSLSFNQRQLRKTIKSNKDCIEYNSDEIMKAKTTKDIGTI